MRFRFHKQDWREPHLCFAWWPVDVSKDYSTDLRWLEKVVRIGRYCGPEVGWVFEFFDAKEHVLNQIVDNNGA